MDMNSLAHMKWECKNYIVFAPKFRRKVICEQEKEDVCNVLSVHMFDIILHKISVSQDSGVLERKELINPFMGELVIQGKNRSSRKLASKLSGGF